ncbi:MAG: F0F1 ATP synthase subunit A [Dehalococcoidia bacterium]|nr:MAG: F0F1 ATP synthase subunit A [Dehalococcoidia bacterium]
MPEEPKNKKGCLGCSIPVLIGLIGTFLILILVSFAAGPLGTNLLGDIGLPDWLSIPQPHPELPAEVVFHIFGFPITNSIIAAWVTITFLVVFSYAVTRRMKIIPGRLQAAFEFLLDWLYNLCTSVAGEENGRKFFPIVATIFLFVGFNAWLGLLPGFGSILVHTAEGEVHLLRPANTDINMPLALALVSFVFVEFTGIRRIGIGYMKKFVNTIEFRRGLKQVFKGNIKSGLLGIFAGGINIFTGFLEFFTELIRIVSLTFRLFGNMTAGEILLLVVAFLIPWLFSIPFYGLELLIGFIQALIFAGLTLIFVTVAVIPHEEGAH